MDQWNRIEDPDINPHTCGHLILDKKSKLYNGEKKTSSTNGAGLTERQHVEECKGIHICHHAQKSTRIKDPSIDPDNLSMTEEKVGNILESVGTRDNFLNRNLKGRH